MSTLDKDAKLGFGNIFAGGAVKLKSVGSPPLASAPPASKAPSRLGPKTVIKAEAEFDYEAEQDDEISFVEGDIILISNKEIYEGWAEGEIGGKKGVFPNNFVTFFEMEEAMPLPPPPSPKPLRAVRQETAPPPTSTTSTAPADRNGHVEGKSAVAAKAAFLNSELTRGGGRSPNMSRRISASEMIKSFNNATVTDSSKSKTLSSSLTAAELRQFALNHKDEYKRSKKMGRSGAKRTPVNPSLVPNIEDVKVKISQSASSPVSPTDIPRFPESPPATPPIPPPSPKGLRNTLGSSAPPPSTKPVSPRLSRPPSRAIPVPDPDEMYMEMEDEGNVVSSEEVGVLRGRIEVLESSAVKMSKLVTMLQDDLDEEINHRKSIETELTRLKKIVAVLQDN